MPDAVCRAARAATALAFVAIWRRWKLKIGFELYYFVYKQSSLSPSVESDPRLSRTCDEKYVEMAAEPAA